LTNKKNILIIKHGALGDIIESEGLMRAIRNHHLESKITFLTSSRDKSLIECFYYIDKVMTDDRSTFWNVSKNFLLLKELRNCKFDIVYDLQNSQRTSIYKKFFLIKPQWISTNRKIHPISGLIGLVEMLEEHGVRDKKSYIPDISWMASDVSQLLKNNNIKSRFILLIPGSSASHKDKRWPYFNDLSEELINKGFDVVSILGPDEMILEDSLYGKIFKNLAWGDLVGVINNATFVIGNDTGPSHIASCLGKSGIALFGPTTALQSGLSRPPFAAIESDNLSKITIKKVMKKLLLQLDSVKN
jgi:ADP-heptose:LPS heptosyltransferase